MKKFLKPTKFKKITCLIGGVACILPMLFAYLESPRINSISLLFRIFSFIPDSIFFIFQIIFSPILESIDSEIFSIFFLVVFAILRIFFYFAFFYLVASFIECYRNSNLNEQRKKDFFKLTKFKILSCYFFGLLYPLAMYFLHVFEPINKFGEIVRIVVYIYTLVVYVVPGTIINAVKIALELLGIISVSNNEESAFSQSWEYKIIILFNILAMYLIASWIEQRKNKK